MDFDSLIGLPPSIEHPAQVTLISCIPLQFLFFFRIPYFVVMYVGKATGKASVATIARIILTALLSPLFCMLGLVGPIWAVVCLTIPVALEALDHLVSVAIGHRTHGGDVNGRSGATVKRPHRLGRLCRKASSRRPQPLVDPIA